jgi:hypothetical protein
MAKVKKENRAESKRESPEQPKKVYRIRQSEDRGKHQIDYKIEQKVVWKSEIGDREEWITVREWKIGRKTGYLVDQIIKNVLEAKEGKPLSEAPPYKDPQVKQ